MVGIGGSPPGTPASVSVTAAGSGSTANYCYQVASVDAQGGIGVASPPSPVCVMGPAELGMGNDLSYPSYSVGNQGMTIAITPPSSGMAPAAYAVYGYATSGISAASWNATTYTATVTTTENLSNVLVVGGPIYITGVSPSNYNSSPSSAATITALSASSISYCQEGGTGACQSAPTPPTYVGGGFISSVNPTSSNVAPNAFLGFIQAGHGCPGTTSNACYVDSGHMQAAPFWMLTRLPQAASQYDILYTTISSGGGTNILTIPAPTGIQPPIQQIGNLIVFHDDGVALRAAVKQAGTAATVPCGTFTYGQDPNATMASGLVISAAGVYLHGSGAGCTVLQPAGVFDAVSFSGNGATSFGGLDRMQIDAGGLAGGYAVTIAGFNQVKIHDFDLMQPYGCYNIGAVNRVIITDTRADGDIRGQYCIYQNSTEASPAQQVSNPCPLVGGALNNFCYLSEGVYINNFQGVKSFSAVGYYGTGSLTTVELNALAILEEPYVQFQVDNAVNATTGPQLVSTTDLALNLCNGPCMEEMAGLQFKHRRSFVQPGNGTFFMPGSTTLAAPAYIIGPGVSNVDVDGMDVFNAQGDGIFTQGFNVSLRGVNAYADSQAAGNQYAGIHVAVGASGTTLNDIHNYAIVAGQRTTIEAEGVLVDSLSSSISSISYSPGLNQTTIGVGFSTQNVVPNTLVVVSGIYFQGSYPKAYNVSTPVVSTTPSSITYAGGGSVDAASFVGTATVSAQATSVGTYALSGSSCDVDDQAGAPQTTVIDLGAAPPTTVIRMAAGVTLSASAYGSLYHGTGGGVAKLCRSSGGTTPLTDTLDTAAHIVAAIPGATAGVTFRIRLVSSVHAQMTLAGNSAGVTVSGNPVTNDAGGGGALISHDFGCVVTNAMAGSESVSCHG